MNHKKIVVVAVLAMFLATSFVVVAPNEDNEADTTYASDVNIINIKLTGTQSTVADIPKTKITTTKNSIPSNVSTVEEWYPWVLSGNLPSINGQSVLTNSPEGIPTTAAVNDLTLGLKPVAETPGFFDLIFTGDSYAGKDCTFNVAYKLTSTLKTGEIVQILYFTINIMKMTTVTITDGDKDSSPTVSEEIKLGVPFEKQLSISDKNFEGTNCVWYAEGLPPGLAMTTEGKIIGVPTTLTVGSAKAIKISITDENGWVHNGTYTITVVGQSKIKVAVESGADYIGTGTLDNKNVNRYMMFTNSDATFTFTYNGLMSGKGVIVYTIEDGKKTEIKKEATESNKFTVSPTGTGELSVELKTDDSLALFTILVVNKVQNVNAGISFDLEKR